MIEDALGHARNDEPRVSQSECDDDLTADKPPLAGVGAERRAVDHLEPVAAAFQLHGDANDDTMDIFTSVR